MLTHNEVKTLLDEIYQQEVCIHQIPGVTLFEIGDESIIYDKYRGFIFGEYNFLRKIKSIDDCNKARVELRKYTERRELLERILTGDCEYQTQRSFKHIEYVGNYIFGRGKRSLYVTIRNRSFYPIDDWYGFFRMLDIRMPNSAHSVYLRTENYHKMSAHSNASNTTSYKNRDLNYENLK